MTGIIVSIIRDVKKPGSDQAGGGYGFLRGDGERFERFFHAKSVKGSFTDLQQDDRVVFEPEAHAKGDRAKDVQRCR